MSDSRTPSLMPDAPRLLSHIRPFQTVKRPKCCQRNCHLADDLQTGVEIRINRLCILGSIVASQQWGACRLCIEHATTFDNLLEVRALVQVDSAIFASDSHLEELIRFSKVSVLPFVHELRFDGINNSLVRATEYVETPILSLPFLRLTDSFLIHMASILT